MPLKLQELKKGIQWPKRAVLRLTGEDYLKPFALNIEQRRIANQWLIDTDPQYQEDRQKDAS